VIDEDALASCLVHEVETDDDPVCDLEDLEDEVQVALDRCGVGDDDDAVGLAEEDEVARDLPSAAAERRE
jgi:hypothetical protein